MRLVFIVAAIACAWVSGVAIGGSESPRAVNGAVVFLILAILFGVAAWWMQ